MNQWQSLLAEAGAGRLALHPAVGARLADECERCLVGLNEALYEARHVARVDGFGGFASSTALEAKFTRKGSAGDDSIDKRIREHIEVVQLMQETFKKAIANYEQTDAANAQSVAGVAV